MKRGALLLVLLAVIFASASPAAAEERHAGHVLIVSYPGLQWEQVVDERPPVLLHLLQRSAVASMSIRTIGPTTKLGEAYATIGAGNRATSELAIAGLAYPPDAAVEGDLAAEAFARRCGCSAAGMAVLHLGMPRVTRSNDSLLYGAVPGSLGAAVAASGGHAAVVANADRATDAVGDAVHREAALAVVDDLGRVPLGNVGSELVMEDPTSPYGVRTSIGATTEAVRAAWGGASVLLLEMSDLDRVESYADLANDDAIAAARVDALQRADELLGAALAEVDLDRDLVIVLGPTGPRIPAELTAFAIAGRGVEPGVARSATTRRDGFVTLPDIAPTVLDFLGIEVPSAMTGTKIRSAGGDAPDIAALRALVDDNEISVFRDKATGPASVTFIVLQVLGYALAALALTRWRRMRPWVAWLLLVPLAQAPLAFLSGLFRYDRLTVPGYVVAHVVGGVALAGFTLALGRWSTPRLGDAAIIVAPLALVGLTVAVLIIDVVVGGPLQLNTVFGYSPTVAGRFAGFGNLAFSLLAAAAIMAVTGAWAAVALRNHDRAPARRGLGLVFVGVALAVVVVVDGLPSLGSDVGGVLALVPASAVVMLLLAGYRVGWARVGLIAFGTATVLVGLALFDLSRPEESRTHLGRLAAKLFSSDQGGVATVLHRKIAANLGILTSSVWTWVIPVALGFLAFIVWRRPGSLRVLEERVPGLRAGLVGSLVAGVVGFAVNDSGIAVPAMMLAVVLPFASFLLVQTAD